MSNYKPVGSYDALRARAGGLPVAPLAQDEKITPAMKKAYAEKLAREEYGKSYSQLTPAEKREIDGYVAEEVFRTGDAGSLAQAKAVIHKAFLRGGNAADNYAEMGVEDLKNAFDLSDEDAKKLYEYVRSHP